jgi:hypothetical protein
LTKNVTKNFPPLTRRFQIETKYRNFTKLQETGCLGLNCFKHAVFIGFLISVHVDVFSKNFSICFNLVSMTLTTREQVQSCYLVLPCFLKLKLVRYC